MAHELSVILDGHQALEWLTDRGHEGLLVFTTQFRVVAFPPVREGGPSLVAFVIDLDDGRTLVAETTLALFAQACEKMHVHGPLDLDETDETSLPPDA